MSFPGKLFGLCNSVFPVEHRHRVNAEYDGQVTGYGKQCGNVIIRLAEEMIAGDTGKYNGDQQE
jgi:hypothetical protein